MNKKLINTLIFLSLLALIALLLNDLFLTENSDKEITEVETYDEIQIDNQNSNIYSEEKQIELNYNTLSGIDFIGNSIYLSADSSIIRIDSNFKIIDKIEFNNKPKNAILRNDSLFVLFDNYFAIYDKNNKLLIESNQINEKSYFTAFDIKADKIFIADAMEKKVHVFSLNAEKLYSFLGTSNRQNVTEFVIPSPFFHLEFDAQNELWITNPGIHLLQNYSEIGELKKSWGESSMQIHGFSSCCNPAYFSIFKNGNFLTSEKSNVRVKVYDAQGNFLYKVADAKQLNIKKKAPQPAIDDNGNIYLLDFENKLLRIFKAINNG
jgi:hypothetical protein